MSDGIKLYGFWRSLATYRVRIALSLKGLKWEEDTVDILSGAQFSDEFSRLNAMHALPVMIDNGTVLTQSLAIMEYLDERYADPPLLPAGPVARSRARAFALITIADSHPLTVPRSRKRLTEQFGATEDDIVKWAQHWGGLGLKAMEAQLAARTDQTPFCFGDRPGLADIGLASHAAGATIFGASLDAFPTVKATLARCQELEAFTATSPQVMKAKAGL